MTLIPQFLQLNSCLAKRNKQTNKTSETSELDVTISIVEEKVFFTKPTWLHDTNPRQSWLEGIFLSLIRAVYDKPTANIILNGGKLRLKAIPVKWGARQGSPLPPTPTQQNTWSTITAWRQKKENKEKQIEKQVKLLLFENVMILYRSPLNTRTLLGTISAEWWSAMLLFKPE